MVEMGTKSLRNLKEEAVYDEGKKITEEKLMLKVFVDNISLVNRASIMSPSTLLDTRLRWLTHPKINNESQNNMPPILNKNRDCDIW